MILCFTSAVAASPQLLLEIFCGHGKIDSSWREPEKSNYANLDFILRCKLRCEESFAVERSCINFTTRRQF